HCGEVRRFRPGEVLLQEGKAGAGMYVILSGRVAVAGRDAVGQAIPVAKFAELIGATLEDMAEVVPGEVLAEIGELSGQPSLSVIDAQAVGEVEAIVVPPEGLRALLIAEAELGERILRALILRRVAQIEMGFGGPVLIGPLNSPEVIRLSAFLGRSGIPFRVIDPHADADASSLLARFAPQPAELPIVIMPDGAVLKNPTKQDLARALGLVATTLRSEPYDVAIVGAGPAGLATAVYGASEGLSILVLEAGTFGGQAGDPEPGAVRGPRRLVLGLAGRGSAVPQRGGGPAGRRKLGGAGSGLPLQPCARGADAGARDRPLEDHVALSDRPDRGLLEHLGALRDRDRGAPGHGRPGSAGGAVAQPPHRNRGGARHRPLLPLHRRRPGRQLARRLRRAAGRQRLHPNRRRRGFDGASPAADGDRSCGDLRRGRRPFGFGEAGGGGHRGRGGGGRPAAHFPLPARFHG